MEQFRRAYGFVKSFLNGIFGFCCICLLEWEYCSWYVLHSNFHLLLSEKHFSSISLILFTVYNFVIPSLKIISCTEYTGAKDAHAVSPHFSQFLYYGIVSSLFTFPAHFSFGQAATLLQHLRMNRLLGFFQWFMALAFGFLSVKFFRLNHQMIISKPLFSLIVPWGLTKYQFICLIQHCPSISLGGQSALSFLSLAESHQLPLVDQVPYAPVLCLLMVLHSQ